MKVTNHNRNYAYSTEAHKIVSNNKACDIIEHFSMDEEWQWILKDDKYRREKDNGTNVNRHYQCLNTEEDHGTYHQEYC